MMIRGLAVLVGLTLTIGCSAARSSPNLADQRSNSPELAAPLSDSTAPSISPSPRPTNVVTTTALTYRKLNNRNPSLTGEANVRPGLLVKVVRTIYNPPVAGECDEGYAPAGVNEQGRIRMIVNVSNDKTGAGMDSEIRCVHHHRRGR
jgi:hypothetical protein